MKLSIPEMNCGHCQARVEKAIAGVDGAARITVDLSTRRAEVESGAGADKLIAALAAAGYPASLAG